jgi:hypothetical protein
LGGQEETIADRSSGEDQGPLCAGPVKTLRQKGGEDKKERIIKDENVLDIFREK